MEHSNHARQGNRFGTYREEKRRVMTDNEYRRKRPYELSIDVLSKQVSGADDSPQVLVLSTFQYFQYPRKSKEWWVTRLGSACLAPSATGDHMFSCDNRDGETVFSDISKHVASRICDVQQTNSLLRFAECCRIDLDVWRRAGAGWFRFVRGRRDGLKRW